MTTEHSNAVRTAWAEGITYFAVSLSIVAGIFQVLQGIAALANGTVFVSAPGHAYAFSLTAWGWIHLIIGILLFAVGVGLFYGKDWARGAGVGIAVVQAISQFMFLPYYPVWSIVILALDVALIWGLTTFRSRDFM